MVSAYFRLINEISKIDQKYHLQRIFVKINEAELIRMFIDSSLRYLSYEIQSYKFGKNKTSTEITYSWRQARILSVESRNYKLEWSKCCIRKCLTDKGQQTTVAYSNSGRTAKPNGPKSTKNASYERNELTWLTHTQQHSHLNVRLIHWINTKNRSYSLSRQLSSLSMVYVIHLNQS